MKAVFLLLGCFFFIVNTQNVGVVATDDRCPSPTEDQFGTCTSDCDPSEESPCDTEGQICCPGVNGCANACVEPTPPIDERCPRPREHQFGICTSECDPSEESPCDTEGQICCPGVNGCANACVNSTTQCVGPDGDTYNPGETFPASDGCNTCFCQPNGNTACTEIGCINRCYLEPPPAGDCTAAIPRYYYEPGTTRCRRYLGGCETATDRRRGNSFATPADCYEQCNQESICNAPIYPPNFIPACNVLLRQWTFNSTTGQCVEFQYHPCGEDRVGYNVFEDEESCRRTCDILNDTGMCNAPIYPPNFLPICAVLIRQWTFNSTTGQCVEFQYHPCGEDRVGYNVFEDEESCQRTCDILNATDTCPPGQPLVLCFADPCQVTSCPNYPDANCTSNFCGGCNANFFDEEGNDVTGECRDTCDDGSLMVDCFQDPCESATCPEFPEAECMANYCGGCNFNFFDDDGSDVTRQCRRSLPVPIREPLCPHMDPSLADICMEGCSSNSDCTGEQICCRYSCSSSCQNPVFTPYYRVPQVCPATALEDLFTICSIDEESCISNSECEEGELCCQDGGCGRTCTDAVQSDTPCFEVVERIRTAQNLIMTSATTTTTQPLPPGYYVPTCRADGRFEPVQCSGSTGSCWCVDITTGRPVGPSVSSPGTRPQCGGCSIGDQSYQYGETFPSDDGCNTCTCLDSGFAACTLIACVDPCSLPSAPGPCRAFFPAFYYDSESESCRSFVYGGCGGNANKFGSVRDCLRRCNPQDECLLPMEPGPCEAYFPSFFFNRESGQCESFVYGGCEGNENRFSTIEECLDQCSPDETPDRCATVRCAEPDCLPGFTVATDDRHCCPYCAPIGECEDAEYRCADGECIPEGRLCDGLRDCSDGADEEECDDTCEFRCGDRTCLPISQVCDNIIDCRDGADIRNCSRRDREFRNVRYLTKRDIPMVCPNVSDTLGICVSECSGNSECEDGQICCSNGCGQTCIDGIEVGSLCTRILGVASTTSSAFTPMCEEDGNFSPVQCFEGYCWCVDVVSGQPASDGVEQGEELECGGCRRPGQQEEEEEISVGDSYSTDDGCNTCTCIGNGEVVCSLRPCLNAPCKFQDRMIESDTDVSDECNTCRCFAGSLTCQKKECNRATTGALMQLRRATLPFAGDFDAIRDQLEDFKREVIRSFLNKYATSLGFEQDQIREVEVREGSIIVVVTFAEANSTSGANLTVLLGQVQQDYETGTLVIRYDDQILQPSGEFQVSDPEDEDGEEAGRLLGWHIAVIVVGCVILVAVTLVIVILVVVGMKKKDSSNDKDKTNATSNDYELPVTSGISEKELLKENLA